MKTGAYQMKKELLSLIGCGWLGKALALDLQRSGHNIIATTAHDKSAEFAKDDVPYIQLDAALDLVPESIKFSDVLIYMVPPLGVSHVKHLFDQIPSDKKIIFISSISIYGKNLGNLDEETEHHICSTGSPLLMETENYIKNKFSNATILRLGGLYGYKRHPVYSLQGKTELTGGHAFLHLVHRDDCISAIKAVLKTSVWGETFNIVSDVKLRKNEYYTLMANKLDLTPPQYLHYERSMKETVITNLKSKMKLGMTYLDPIEFCTFSE
jgi:nucleoside-diphosphate-sugar epimerase